MLERFTANHAWMNTITGAATIVCTLPYRWLRLDRLFYYRNHPEWVDWRISPSGAPRLAWFPQARLFETVFPGQIPFFIFLFAAILAAAAVSLAFRNRIGRSVTRRTVLLFVGVAALIGSETWLHLSLRSPYNYILHYVPTRFTRPWLHVYLFENGTGPVTADFYVFRSVENIFIGSRNPEDGMVTNRPFPYYLSSQLTAFVNDYYVMIAMNLAMWLASVFAVRDYASSHFGSRVADIAALLAASAPGFIAFAAQPQTYVWGYGAFTLAIWAHWRICWKEKSGRREYLLFAGLLALAFLTYDLFSLAAYLIGYELLFKRPLAKIAVSLSVALAAYFLFNFVVNSVPSIVHAISNASFMVLSFQSIVAVFRSFPLALSNYRLYADFLPSYFRNLGEAVFVFPMLLGLTGVFMIRELSKLRLIILLALPSFLNFAFLHFGQSHLSGWPRFEFTGYLAVYILCGVAVAAFTDLIVPYRHWLFPSATAIVIAANIISTNIDAFGYPWLYYFFYVASPDGSAF
jgi:hypothetical protein